MTRHLLLLLATASLGACATRPGSDPLGGYNRAMFKVNDAVDKAVLRPVTVGVRTVTPTPVRRGFSRVLENLTEPWSAINSLLQGKPGRAANSLGRFVINTTIGVGGLADHATGLGLKPTREDLGQTLATWGVKDGGYLVLPLLGPSTVRDAAGIGVGMIADPQYVFTGQVLNPTGTESAMVVAGRVLSARSDLVDSGVEQVLATSADPYATTRSAYFQRRAADIADKDGSSVEDAERELDAALRDIDGGDAGADATGASARPTRPAPVATRRKRR